MRKKPVRLNAEAVKHVREATYNEEYVHELEERLRNLEYAVQNFLGSAMRSSYTDSEGHTLVSNQTVIDLVVLSGTFNENIKRDL